MQREATHQLKPSDYGLLALLALVLFGYGTISGKPLTMHEARLPECSREMLASGNWLLPMSGARPWLERPPFPHWMELITGHIFGRLDAVWIVRIPPAVAGLLILLTVAWTGARLFGRQIGVLAGVALASMYEFYFYAGQAEDDIFLALLVTVSMAAFVATEFPEEGRTPDERTHFFGNRTWTVWVFFIVLGMTSLAKGPLVGAIDLCSGVGVFLLLSWREKRIGRYLWLWGWIFFSMLTVGWSVYAASVYPSLWANYKYDYAGPFGKEAPWYYFICIIWTTAPWTLLWVPGLFIVWPRKGVKLSPEMRLLLCWALVPLLVLSIPSRKHHHYLLPVLPAYAVLAAFGMRRLGEIIPKSYPRILTGFLPGLLVGLAGLAASVIFLHKVPGPSWVTLGLGVTFLAVATSIGVFLKKKNMRMVLAICYVEILIGAAWGQSVLGIVDEYKSGDLPFLTRARETVPADKPLMIDAYGSLDFFRIQFYLRPDAVLLHNITYLRDERITAPQVYVIAHAYRQDFISQLGDCKVIDASSMARREVDTGDRYTLFLLTFKPGLQRYPAPKVSVLQALDRGVGDEAGPFCGPPAPDDPALHAGEDSGD